MCRRASKSTAEDLLLLRISLDDDDDALRRVADSLKDLVDVDVVSLLTILVVAEESFVVILVGLTAVLLSAASRCCCKNF